MLNCFDILQFFILNANIELISVTGTLCYLGDQSKNERKTMQMD